jgi:hypothetical protein
VLTDALDLSDAEIVNALNIGSNNIVTGATTISSAELDRLDGKDAALVDTNDAVNTAITGTGALNSGSITSGFGSIDTGSDAISGGAVTATALLTGQLGATISGAAISLNASSNFATNINTGSSNALVTIGGGSGTFALDTTNIDISSSGAITNATGITSATGDITATAGNVAITAGNLTLNGTTRISNAGVGTFITGTVIGSQTFTTNNIADSGALTIASGSASALTLNSGTTGTINIGTDASAETINIGTGSAAKTVAVGSTNTTSATTIQSGSGNITLQAAGSGTTGNVIIGETGATPDLLVLGIKNTAGNPTAVEGATYYNSNTGKFYIAEGSTPAWKEVCNKTDAACGAGSGSAWSALSNPSANLSLSHAEYTTSFNWDTAATAAAKDYVTLSVTNDASTDATTQRLLVLANADTTGSTATERLLVLDNQDTDEVVTTGLEITSAAGGITTAIDVSDADITTGIALGNTNVTVGGATISSTEFARLDGKDAALVDTNDAVNTAITGTGALNAGSITSGFGAIDTGTDNITTTGTGNFGTLIVNGSSSITNIAGTGLTISGGALQATLGTSVDLTSEVTGILPASNGGTGVNNGSNTITIAGNINTAAAFTTSGANALTLTTTASTNQTSIR